MSKKNWCSGAGRLAPVKEPTNLVDCPVCARKDLGAKFDHYDYAVAHVGGVVGIVPPHAARPMRPEQIPAMRFVGEHAERNLTVLREYIELQHKESR